MIPGKLRAALIIALIVFFIIILGLLKKRRLALKYTLLWLLTGVILLILAIFPEIILGLIGLVGIQSPMNGLYVFLIAFLFMLTMSLTSIVSKQTERIRNIAEANAILEQKVRDLQKEMDRIQNDRGDLT